MKFKKIIAITVVVIAGIGFLISQGYYPVAIVGSDIISAAAVKKNGDVALRYFHALNTINGSSEDLNTPEVLKEIKRGMISQLIEDNIIYDKAKELVGKDLSGIADKKVNDVLSQAGAKDMAEEVYGISLGDFSRYVLYPQAYREIVEDRIFLGGGDFNAWLSEAKKNSKVTILLSSFAWKDGDVALK
ncbi:MAG: hypothetical protein PHP03_00955 [Candidatus Pacebacteria bacterium]|nr:hypothetical protein [Candidatus Paceibacterota bacterium]